MRNPKLPVLFRPSIDLIEDHKRKCERVLKLQARIEKLNVLLRSARLSRAASYSRLDSQYRPKYGLGLSSREQQIMKMVREHKSNKEIAGEINVSPRTVKWHIANILKKMMVTRRGEL